MTPKITEKVEKKNVVAEMGLSNALETFVGFRYDRPSTIHQFINK
jgi:hypothetical protein